MPDTPSSEPTGHVVALVGLMGSGKTTVGAELAARTGWRFVDLDAVVVADAGRSIPEIFAAEGESGFRARELEALRRVVGGAGSMVLATGGGLVTVPEARRVLIEKTTVVWLDAPVGVLAARLGEGAGRPLLAGDVVSTLESLDAARRAAYQDVADVVVAADRAPGQVVDDVLARIGALA